MKVKRAVYLSIIMLVLTVFSFQALAELEAVKYPGYVKDETGKKLYLKETPQRIVSCIPSITEMLYAIGLENRIVGVTINCDYPKAAQKKEKIGRTIMNVEKILSLRPDLVILLKSAQKRDIEKLRKHKLPVFVINPSTIKEVMFSLKTLGRVTGNTAEAESLVNSMHGRLKKIKRTIGVKKEKSVVVIVGNRPLVVAGYGTFIDDMIKLAGGKNIASCSRVSYPQYSLENYRQW